MVGVRELLKEHCFRGRVESSSGRSAQEWASTPPPECIEPGGSRPDVDGCSSRISTHGGLTLTSQTAGVAKWNLSKGKVQPKHWISMLDFPAFDGGPGPAASCAYLDRWGCSKGGIWPGSV